MQWNTHLYDDKHRFVSQYGEEVIDLLAPQAGELILDIGCGTGDLAELITQQGADVIGIDSSTEMIEAAKIKYPHIKFEVKSASNFSYDFQFDAIFSNATLHWVLEYEEAIKCIYQALKPSGRFVAEFGGRGNVSNIVDALKLQLIKRGYSEIANKPVWYFPSLAEYASLLEQQGFRVVFAAHFDRETLLKSDDGIKNWLQMFGKLYLQDLDKDVVESIVNEVENQIRPTNYKNGSWYADYVRLRIMAIKNVI